MRYIILFIMLSLTTAAFSQKKANIKKETTVSIGENSDKKIKQKYITEQSKFKQFISQFEQVKLPYQVNEHTFHYTNVKTRKELNRNFSMFLPELANLSLNSKENSRTFYADKLIQRTDEYIVVTYAIQPKAAKVPSEYYLAIFTKNNRTRNYTLSDKMLLAKYNNQKSVLTASIDLSCNIITRTVGFDLQKEKGQLKVKNRYFIDKSLYKVQKGKFDKLSYSKTTNKYYQPVDKSKSSSSNTVLDN